MGLPGSRREALLVAALCCVWYALSSAASVAGKLALSARALPATLAGAQLLCAAACSRSWRGACGARGGAVPPLRALLPLAAAKLLIALLSGVALWKVPVSYAHTVKATTPLWTATLAFVLFGERQSRAVLSALVVIACGVGVASLTELSFDWLGLVSALGAAALLALQHLYSKRLLTGGTSPLLLLERLSALALLMLMPLWLWLEGGALLYAAPPTAGWPRWVSLVLTAGLLSWLQAAAALAVLRRVSPLAYGVASAAKRAVVVALSLLALGNPAPPANVLGMCVAALGVLAYNRAKRTQTHTHRAPLLPV